MKAGVKEFDVVTAIDGKAVQYRDELIAAVRARAPGDEVELSVIAAEGQKAGKVKVTLGLLEAGWVEALNRAVQEE
jgi:putative serine protease PepD